MKLPGCLLACAFVGLSFTGGCVGRAISEVAGVATGPKGLYTVIDPVARSKDDRPLGDYTSFELQIKNDFGSQTPSELVSQLPREFQKDLAKKKIFERPGKTLVVDCTILHYEEASLFGEAFGPFEEVVARVRLVDKASGKVLGSANCIGRSNTTTNEGVYKKTEGLASAMANWIRSLYPKAPGEAEEEKD